LIRDNIINIIYSSINSISKIVLLILDEIIRYIVQKNDDKRQVEILLKA